MRERSGLPAQRSALASALANLVSNAAEHGAGPVDVRGSTRPRRPCAWRSATAPGGLRAAGGERGRGLAIADDAAREAGGSLAVDPGRRRVHGGAGAAAGRVPRVRSLGAPRPVVLGAPPPRAIVPSATGRGGGRDRASQPSPGAGPARPRARLRRPRGLAGPPAHERGRGPGGAAGAGAGGRRAACRPMRRWRPTRSPCARCRRATCRRTRSVLARPVRLAGRSWRCPRRRCSPRRCSARAPAAPAARRCVPASARSKSPRPAAVRSPPPRRARGWTCSCRGRAVEAAAR